MELAILFSIIGALNFIIIHRKKIYDILDKSENGQRIMFPVLAPYVFDCLIKLMRNEHFAMMVLNAEKQKKIDHYL